MTQATAAHYSIWFGPASERHLAGCYRPTAGGMLGKDLGDQEDVIAATGDGLADHLLDGTRSERSALLRAAELGAPLEDARALLETLRAAGLVLATADLLPTGLPHESRRRLIGEASALAGAVEHLDLDWFEYVPGYRTPAGTGTGLSFATWT